MRLDRYDIKEEIGRGPRSVVYRAYERDLGRVVVLKVLRRYDDESMRKFQREATITANLSHKGIRKVYGAERTQRRGRPLWYIVMQYVDNSLQKMLGRPMKTRRAVNVAAQIADVLDYVHRKGLVHLDVKPGNILIFNDGRAVLSDFGIARRIGEPTTDGTPQYLSPEQARGEPVQPASDVYSLGVVLYELLTGQPPFRAENDLALMQQHADPRVKPRSLRQLNPQLTPEAERIVLKALEKDLDRRYTSAAALAKDLRELPTKKSTRITTLVRQVPKPAWFVVVLMSVLIVLVLAALSRRPPPAPVETPTVTVQVENLTETPLPATTEPVSLPGGSTGQSTRETAPTSTLRATPWATRTPTSTPSLAVTPTPEIAAICPNPNVRITSPAPGATVSTDVAIWGTARFERGPKSFYKVEWRGPNFSQWTSMGQIHRQPVEGSRLEFWRIGGYTPGIYRLRLVIVEDAKEIDECVIQVEKVSE